MMPDALQPGVVRITADVSDGRVVARTVFSDRPRGLAAAIARQPPVAIPDLTRRLFALCGTSHWLAAINALAMAGAALEAPSPSAAVRMLAAERVVAHLQATFMDWGSRVQLIGAEAAALSSALTAARGSQIDGGALLEAVTTLGMATRDRHAAAGSWVERLLFAAGDDPIEQPTFDVLTGHDDEQVLAALDDQEEAFTAAPWLPGRRPETGPAARAALRGLRAASPAERLCARLAEVAEAADLIAGTLLPDPSEWLSTARLGPGVAFCAIETPRGRLHHLVRLDAQARVQRYLILAPTEWNFAADGPFAAALQHFRIAEDDTAQSAIGRLASLYNPCVGCAITVRDPMDRPASHQRGISTDVVRGAP
ncbi:coenzyme F420-reducing hydrogenase alpha subunit [Rhodopseudomonas rhenobacensis]|uniref:Coenzyme F420-reducing hydrogenase alpha subunit n=1 Tax=Rhodopseudomonas rhenobacensis TaxID=87461 RepID=A0A7W7Z1E4_9BRAD|nr:nickel-dependent hydrogenase large subunit [Rhodopseudomonas rhenobacensis]MBB5046239.1 coenzyme F420-reducing hydrogenase alpha subunit [Rhodopseudomonas rhenobacensis]